MTSDSLNIRGNHNNMTMSGRVNVEQATKDNPLFTQGTSEELK